MVAGVNAFGFLPGAEIAADPASDLNPGLLDQEAALIWTNKYIEKFGGDASNVTIWGQSAGAGSVVAQVIANGGMTNPPLFSKALTSSPFWPKTYYYDAPEVSQVLRETFFYFMLLQRTERLCFLIQICLEPYKQHSERILTPSL